MVTHEDLTSGKMAATRLYVKLYSLCRPGAVPLHAVQYLARVAYIPAVDVRVLTGPAVQIVPVTGKAYLRTFKTTSVAHPPVYTLDT